MRIFLIGYMGCGKSTIGKKLARKLKLDFIDTDHLIEKEQGCSISEIFKYLGEKEFRKIEHETLVGLVKTDNTLIATGGGMPCFDNNMDMISSNGIAVYLKMSPPQLASRLIQSSNERPLIAGKSKEELIHIISLQLIEREKFYEKANIIFPAGDFNTDSILNLEEKIKAFISK